MGHLVVELVISTFYFQLCATETEKEAEQSERELHSAKEKSKSQLSETFCTVQKALWRQKSSYLKIHETSG